MCFYAQQESWSATPLHTPEADCQDVVFHFSATHWYCKHAGAILFFGLTYFAP